MRVLPAVVLLCACQPGEPVAWVEGFGYGWTGFNHRVSHIGFAIVDDEAEIAIVGGTSTSNEDPVLPGECDPDACFELSTNDTADVDLRWVRVAPKKERTGVEWVDIVADADGETVTAVVPLDRKARGDVFAVIGGFVLDTDHAPSGGPSCYDPAYGWHPRRIAVTLGEPRLSGSRDAVEVDVTAIFEAGLSLEAERACIDAIATQALVPMGVQVVAIVGKDLAIDVADVTHDETYTWGCEDVSGFCLEPDPQPDPDLDDRPLDLDLSASVAGWTSFDFRFFAHDPDDRGAYLRTLSVAFDAEEGWASGHATNHSPVTQLSGFEYAFAGSIRAMTPADPPERGRIEANVPAEVDAEGEPSLHRFPL